MRKQILLCVETNQRADTDYVYISELIKYFYRDVEDVFLGKQIPDSEKVSAAARFRRKRLLEQVPEANFKSPEIRHHFSNILLVPDRYFERKSC